jgi:hypothetical protein
MCVRYALVLPADHAKTTNGRLPSEVSGLKLENVSIPIYSLTALLFRRRIVNGLQQSTFFFLQANPFRSCFCDE